MVIFLQLKVIFIMQKSLRTLNFYCGENQSAELKVRSCGNFVLVPPDREENKIIHFGEIFWPVSGRACFMEKGRKYILRPKYVWYCPPGWAHDFIRWKLFITAG